MMHLTNYSINKKSELFFCNEDENNHDKGHKRDFKSLKRHLDRNNINSDSIFEKMYSLCIKTIISIFTDA